VALYFICLPVSKRDVSICSWNEVAEAIKKVVSFHPELLMVSMSPLLQGCSIPSKVRNTAFFEDMVII